jgi:biofilm PGA synthesis lipoprotein PgaB
MWRAAWIAALLVLAPAVPAAELPVLVYHDIARKPGPDPYAVSLAAFREQMDYLRSEGYRPLSLRELSEIAAGRGRLPAKPVLLTFDDGLRSFHDLALPVLEMHRYPAVVSVVTGWLDGEKIPAAYAGKVMTWAEVRDVSRSPRVEVLSHTHNLHHGIPANPQGNLAPASITRRYDPATQGFESEAGFRRRVREDLQRAVQRLREETGRAPPGIAWPYGHHERVLTEEAAALGMRLQLVLGDMPARVSELPRIHRITLRSAERLAEFEEALRAKRMSRAVRFVAIELDAVAGGTAAEQEQWLSALLTRLKLLRANAVLINPFSRDGQRAFFRNASLPHTGDLLHHVLHQSRTRAGVTRLLLRIPSTPGVAAAVPELARRHPCDGIVLSGEWQEKDAEAVLAGFADHHPGVLCGTETGAGGACRDFRLMTVVTGKSPSAAGEVPVYYLLANGVNDGADRLVQDLRSLRERGARHYGLRDIGVLADPAALRRVAVEFVRHVPGPGRE